MPIDQSTVDLDLLLLAGFLLVINLITFFVFWLDKLKSNTPGARRIREKTLWLLTLFGGSPAALLAMKTCRHKTKKLSFQAVIAFILTVQIFLIIYLLGGFQFLF